MSATTLVLAAAAKEDSNFLVPNGTFIAELVAFIILLWLINKYVLPPLSKAMTARQDLIDRSIKDSIEAKERLEAAEAEYHELVEQTKADASRIREEARAEGRAIIDELRTKAQEEADRVRARGEQQLEVEREQVVAALRSDIGRLATELAERIVGESLDDAGTQSRVVDRFLEDLDAREGSSSESKGAR